MENGRQHLQPLLTVESGVKINGVRDFYKEFYMESKKLWYIAGPAIFTSLCQYTIGATTQLFAGQLGTIELAAVSVENSVIAGFSYSILVRTIITVAHIQKIHQFHFMKSTKIGNMVHF
nr:multi antimicrobial extrusion protein [Tanacetum cinerariifolium]